MRRLAQADRRSSQDHIHRNKRLDHVAQSLCAGAVVSAVVLGIGGNVILTGVERRPTSSAEVTRPATTMTVNVPATGADSSQAETQAPALAAGAAEATGSHSDFATASPRCRQSRRPCRWEPRPQKDMHRAPNWHELRERYGPPRGVVNCNPPPAQAIRLAFYCAANGQFPVRQSHATTETPGYLLDLVAPSRFEA